MAASHNASPPSTREPDPGSQREQPAALPSEHTPAQTPSQLYGDARDIRVATLRRLCARAARPDIVTASRGCVHAYQTRLQGEWSAFETAHFHAYDAENNVQTRAQMQSVYAELDDKYMAARILLCERLDVLTPATQPRPTANEPPTVRNSRALPDSNLDKVQINKFDGDHINWPSFKHEFLTVVHNSMKFDAPTKLRYLAHHLLENTEAHRIVTELQQMGENYQAVWQNLCEAYEDHRRVVDQHLEAFFDQPQLTTGAPELLRALLVSTRHLVRTLLGFGVDTSRCEAILVFVLFRKLDRDSQATWSRERPPKLVARLEPFLAFLEQRADGFAGDTSLPVTVVTPSTSSGQRANQPNAQSFDRRQTDGQPATHQAAAVPSSTKIASRICPMCKGPHQLYSCQTFRALAIEARINRVKSFGVCVNCLRAGHQSTSCTLKPCNCGAKHNGLLCQTELAAASTPDSAHQGAEPGRTILATAIICLLDDEGNSHRFRAICDSSSPSNLITEACADLLRLPRLTGTGASEAIVATSCVRTTVRARCANSFEHTTNFIVMETIPTDLPNDQIPSLSCPHLNGLDLADPYFHQPGRIDVLLGAEVWGRIAYSKVRNGPPKVRKTRLGWMVVGPPPTPAADTTTTSNRTPLPADRCFLALDEALGDNQREVDAPCQPQPNQIVLIQNPPLEPPFSGFLLSDPQLSDELTAMKDRYWKAHADASSAARMMRQPEEPQHEVGAYECPKIVWHPDAHSQPTLPTARDVARESLYMDDFLHGPDQQRGATSPFEELHQTPPEEKPTELSGPETTMAKPTQHLPTEEMLTHHESTVEQPNLAIGELASPRTSTETASAQWSLVRILEPTEADGLVRNVTLRTETTTLPEEAITKLNQASQEHELRTLSGPETTLAEPKLQQPIQKCCQLPAPLPEDATTSSGAVCSEPEQ